MDRNAALMFILRAQARANDLAGALKTFERIQADDDPKWFAARVRAYGCREIARAKARAGDVDQALTWAKERDAPEERYAALEGVAEGIYDRTPGTRNSERGR